jgi:hypothetical protein
VNPLEFTVFQWPLRKNNSQNCTLKDERPPRARAAIARGSLNTTLSIPNTLTACACRAKR